MASIGSFGRRYDKLDLTFDFLDQTFRVNPTVSQAAVVEFLADASGVTDDEIRGAQLILRLLREVVHPDDFDAFWELAKAERQDPRNDLMPLAQAVLEAATGFPTGPSSDASPGPRPTPRRYEVDLPSPEAPHLSPEALRSMQRLQDRPDLGVAILRAQEAAHSRI